MRKLAFPIATCAILLAFSASALAQTKYRLEVFGAGSFPVSKDFEITVPQSTVPIEGTHDFSLGARGGIRFGGDLKEHWGQDIIYSYGANASRIVIKGNAGDFPISNRIHQLCFNALWYPGGHGPARKVMPFVTAGVGAAFYRIPQKTVNQALDPSRAGLGKLRNQNAFSFNAGAGVAVRINSVWGVRFDVRDYMSRAVRYGLPKSSTDPSATVFPVGGIFHQIEVAIAFVYYFK